MQRDHSVHWAHVDAARLDLSGIKAAIVGGTGGLGRAVAQTLASRGASIVAVGQTFRDAATPGIAFIKADLSLMSEAERVADPDARHSGLYDRNLRRGQARRDGRRHRARHGCKFLNGLVMLRRIAPRLGKDRAGAAMKPRVFIMGYPGSGQVGQLDDLNAESSYGALATHMNTVACKHRRRPRTRCARPDLHPERPWQACGA